MSTPKAPTTEKEVLQEVTLVKPHKHAGKPRAVGDKISVNAAQIKFLKDRNIIK